jgi:hypothetical protein
MSTPEQAVATRQANPFGAAPGANPLQDSSAGARGMQARELAETQTKYLMAEQFPRDERAAMDRIINAFSRVGMAERAEYQFARGGSDIAGPSIHAAQAIAQQWGNIEFGWRELSRGIGYDGVPFSEVEAYAVDLQARNPSRIGFIVRHWRDTKSGGYRLKDERDIYELCANQAQRRKRACILAILPQDVVDGAMEQAEVTLSAKADTSPEAMAKMVAAFTAFGVTKEHIEKRIQRRIDTIGAAQVVQLKRIYASLRDDMSTAADWFEIDKPAAAGSNGSRADAALGAMGAAGGRGAATAATGKDDSHVPLYDDKAAIGAIKSAKTIASLDTVWVSIKDDYSKSGRQIPVEVDGTYTDRKSALNQL